ncbi:MAG: DUF4942 domain-containing protein [Planctomycetaceae bacterium]|nr:DUF4942 domain-containing protein [Planctomycetaceae bacterium]
MNFFQYPKPLLKLCFLKFPIRQALKRKFDILDRDIHSPFDNLTESRFFDIKFYMKGTVHLTFKNNEDWVLFN